MSENKNITARLESVIQKCEDIAFIIQRHGGVVYALRDREGQPALLMLLEAIAEQFHKLQKRNGATEILGYFNPLTLKGIHATRNFIAHDYDGIDLAFVEAGLREIPEIKEICITILEHLNTHQE